jgi:hypothetical protein
MLWSVCIVYCIKWQAVGGGTTNVKAGGVSLSPFWPQVIHSSLQFPIASLDTNMIASQMRTMHTMQTMHTVVAGPGRVRSEFEQLDQGDPVRSPRSRDDGRPRWRRWYVLDLWVLGVDEGRGGGRCRDVLGPLAGVVWSVWRTSWRGRRGVVEGLRTPARAYARAYARACSRLRSP